jgi:hypothetical protein
MTDHLPTLADVLDYVAVHEPTTAQAVATGLGVSWGSRTTVRNRLLELVRDGELIIDADAYPARFALNHLGHHPAPVPATTTMALTTHATLDRAATLCGSTVAGILAEDLELVPVTCTGCLCHLRGAW